MGMKFGGKECIFSDLNCSSKILKFMIKKAFNLLTYSCTFKNVSTNEKWKLNYHNVLTSV